MGWHLEDIIGARFNGHDVVEIKYNGAVVWPAGTTYVITAATLHYSSGSLIMASGLNYAYITGTVEERRGGTVVQTLTDVRLTPVLGATSAFFLSGTEIHGYDLLDNETSQQSVSVSAVYGNSAQYALTSSVYQEANVATPVTLYQDSISLSVNDWTSSVTACAASGGSTSFSLSATRTTTTYTSYTSGYETPHQTQTDTISATPSVSGTGLSYSGSTLSWAGRYRTTGPERTGTLTATTTYGSESVTVYQAENSMTTTYEAILSLASTSISASAQNINMTAIARTNYAFSDPAGDYSSDAANPLQYVTLSDSTNFSVGTSGGQQYLHANANTGYADRQCVVGMTYQGESVQSITVTQAAGAVIPLTVVLTPVISQFESGSFVYTAQISSSDSGITSLHGVEVLFNFGGTVVSDSLEDISLPYSNTRTVYGSGWGWDSATAEIEGTTAQDEPFTKAATLSPLGVSLQASSTQIDSTAQTISVVVRAGQNWTLGFNQNWGTLSSGSGSAGKTTLNLSVQGNTGAERSGTLTLTAGTYTQTLGVTQEEAGLAFVITENTSDISFYYGILSSAPSEMITSGNIQDDGTTLTVYCTNSDTSNSHTFYLGPSGSPVALTRVQAGGTGSMTLSYSDVATLGGNIEIRQSS